MTKKQTIFLLTITALGAGVLISFFFWKFQPLEVAAEPLPTSTQLALAESHLQSAPTEFSAQEPIWPTITPREISLPTATPNPISYDQIEEKLGFPTSTSTPTEAPPIENTPTVNPTYTPTKVSIGAAFTHEETSPFSIGTSAQGTDLWVYRFGSGSIQKLIVAGIHGGYEYNTTNLANELITYVQEYPGIVPKDTTLYILPSLNPDGLARSYGNAGRANANNVDLNRNWDFNWKSTWNPAGCWAYLPIGGGQYAFSEPEAAAMRDFIYSHNISALISYHSAALGIFPGGAPDIDISVGLAEAVSAVAPEYPYPPIQTGCEISGQFVDYASSYGIPALDIELMNHKDSDFDINLEILKVFLNWNQ